MAPANAGEISDPEKLPYITLPRTTYETPPREHIEVERKDLTMRRTSHFILAFLVFVLLSAGVVYASPNVRCRRAVPAAPGPASIERVGAQNFQELLDTVDPASLHEVLHSHLKDKYQHGVYPEDKKAMEVVHQQNAEVAESLIELAKRQATNTTVTPTISTIVTTTEPSTVTSTPTTTAVVTTTPQQTVSAPSSTATSNAPTSAPNTQVASTSTAPTQVVTSTKSEVSGTTTEASETSTPNVSSSAVSVTFEGPLSSLQTTGIQSLTLLESTTAAGGSKTTQGSSTTPSSITQEVVYKTTLANGAVSTVISVTVVAGAAGDNSGGSSTKTNTANASLQTNAASQNSLAMNVVAGVLGFAAVAAL